MRAETVRRRPVVQEARKPKCKRERGAGLPGGGRHIEVRPLTGEKVF